MPTHKILCDLDVGGEVKGTSLDINGAADIAGNLVVSSGGDITCGDDLFMPSAGVINFNSGDMTITHSSNKLQVAGGVLAFTFEGSDYNLNNDCNFIDTEDSNLINFSTGIVTLGAVTTSVTGTLNVAADIVHNGDTDTKIGFTTNAIRVTAGNTVTANHSTEGLDIPKRKLAAPGSTSAGDANGDVLYIGGTTSMTTGAIYHYKSDGTWELADADSAANCDGLLGVALGASSDDDGVLVRGWVVLDHDPGSVGDVLFLSTTAGDATATAPSGNGDIVRVIGYCLHATAGTIFFNPDGTFVEVTA